MGNLADRGVGGGDNRLLDGSAAFGAYTEYRHARGGTYSGVSAADRRLGGDGARFAMDRPAGAWETRIVREVIERESRVLVLRASALAGCLRKIYYAVMGLGGDDEISARDEAVRDVGSALEPIIMDMLRKGDSLDDGRLDDGWLIEGDQIEVVHALDGIEIQGHIDFVGSHPRWTRGQAVVVELKTRSNSQKEYASAVGVERSHRSAALQAALYSVAFAGSIADARGAAVITVSRDDMSYAVNYIPRERVAALYAECVYRAGELKAALEREQPPEPEYPAGHKICRQCEFRGVCGNAILDEEPPGALSEDLVARLAETASSSLSGNAVKARAKARLKEHMIALGLERLELDLDGAKHTLTCPAIMKWDVDMDLFNDWIDPELRDMLVRRRVSHQFRISSRRAS